MKMRFPGLPLVGESFHPYGWQYQVNLERCRRHLRCVVAPQCIWIVPLPLAYPRWVTSYQTRFSKEHVRVGEKKVLISSTFYKERMKEVKKLVYELRKSN